jgi:DNA-binding FadR family transcriptional regulator
LPLESVEPRRLYRQVADQLRQLIESGEFAVGMRLPAERELAEKLSVSRPTVREALIALEVEGLIRIRVGSGIYVQARPRPAPAALPAPETKPAEGPFELLRARELIEGAIAEEAARAARPADIERIDRALEAMAGAEHPSDQTIGFDRDFHVAVAAIVSNAVLERVVAELFDQRINPYFAQLASYFENKNTWREALVEHRQIREAIASADPAAAREAMRRHLRQSQLRFSQSFGEPLERPQSRPAAARRRRPVH